MDEPNTTSATLIKWQGKKYGGGTINDDGVLMGVAAQQ